MRNILMVFSGKAQSGKSTSAALVKTIIDEQTRQGNPDINPNRLGESRVQIHSFATALKDIARQYFGWEGDKGIYYESTEFSETQRVEDAYLPEKVIEDKGRTLLLNIGKKFREIRPTIWVDYVINNIKKINETVTSTFFVIDDMRFKNELHLAKTFHSCVSVRITRKVGALDLDDISEKDLDDAEFDYYVDNDGTPEELKEKLTHLLLTIENQYKDEKYSFKSIKLSDK